MLQIHMLQRGLRAHLSKSTHEAVMGGASQVKVRMPLVTSVHHLRHAVAHAVALWGYIKAHAFSSHLACSKVVLCWCTDDGSVLLVSGSSHQHLDEC